LFKHSKSDSSLFVFFQEKEDFKNRVIELELSEDKKAAQIRELTRLVISLRDEVHKKQHSGFFGAAKKEPEPIPPELEFNDSGSPPVPQNVSHLPASGLERVPQSGSPVMRAAILLASPKLEHA
jgi:hypothetical protein